jgi:hypothetical protein
MPQVDVVNFSSVLDMVGVSPASFWATMVPKVHPYTSSPPPAKKIVVENAGGRKARTVYRRDENVYGRFRKV